ncbi:MAG: helix-turn-helix transcriptional regulator [Lachnospiraceae bacterium]|nr:helix-turn-helix transcriptional regulator [Lachnospiraceae bacterium]
MTLGNRITSLRIKNHMSQGDLAEHLNVSRQSVSKWETDTSVPDLDKLIALSNLFEVSLDQLIRGPLSNSDIAQSTKTSADPHIPQSATTPVTLQNKVGAYCIIISILLTLLAFLGFGERFIAVALILFICGTICLLADRNAMVWITLAIGVPLLVIGFGEGWGTGMMVFVFIVLICFRFYLSSR